MLFIFLQNGVDILNHIIGKVLDSFLFNDDLVILEVGVLLNLGLNFLLFSPLVSVEPVPHVLKSSCVVLLLYVHQRVILLLQRLLDLLLPFDHVGELFRPNEVLFLLHFLDIAYMSL